MDAIAFGAPGIPPTFAAGDKDLVSTALGSSRVWLTVGGGVLNEVFWPNTGRPQLRDLGFLVTGTGFWAEVKRVADYTITTPDPVVPLPTIVHRHERYQLTLQIVADPRRDAVVVTYDLVDLTPDGDAALALHVLAAPHIGGSGHDNDGWVVDDTMYAARGAEALAIVGSPAFAAASAGYVGASDGWQDTAEHGAPQWRFTHAPNGNVALTASCATLQGTLALAFATSSDGARSLAMAALSEGCTSLADCFVRDWREWAHDLPFHDLEDPASCQALTSAMVLHVHEDRAFPGAIVASLATPWGMAHDDPGGYHLVWPRDCTEAGLALAAVGQDVDAAHVLHFLAATQSVDGHWPQNFTPDGTAYWTGLQLDETALPVVLAVKLRELGIIEGVDPITSAMVRRACSYLAANGPYSNQDRWEEASGASPFTIAAMIAALAGAAGSGMLSVEDAAYAHSLADWWNDRIEAMVYVTGSDLDRASGTEGHYVRVMPMASTDADSRVVLANRGGEQIEASMLVGLEFLALVRHGLRAPDDRRILDTLAIVDRVLGVGSLYHRYQDDGYGEHDDGSPFDGTGVGRLWPLLALERGSYALDAGDDAMAYLATAIECTSPGGLLPEQVWDAAAITDRRLFPGRPTGSAMPLVWAHAEFLKLYVGVRTGVRADRIASVAERYADPPRIVRAHVREELDLVTDAAEIAIESARPFRLRYGIDGWRHVADVDSTPTGLGMHAVVLDRADLRGAATLEWTRFDPSRSEWDGVDHRVRLSPSDVPR